MRTECKAPTSDVATNLNALNTALKQNFIGGGSVDPQQDPLLYHGVDYATPGPVPFDSTRLPAGFVTRNLTLNEDFDDYGRLIQAWRGQSHRMA